MKKLHPFFLPRKLSRSAPEGSPGRRESRRRACRGALALAAGLACGAAPASAPPDAVASIRPVHSLLAGVMAGVAEPGLLLRSGESPHTYALRPSDAEMLAAADLVVWIGPSIESFLARPLRELAPNARLLTLEEVPGLTHLPVRRGGLWEEHAHGAHGDGHHGGHHDGHHGEHRGGHHDERHDGHRGGHHDEHHDDHHDEHHGAHDDHHNGHRGERHDAHDDHHDGHRGERHGAHHDEHGDAALDSHIWLDPDNAAVMARAMAEELARLDPERAARYRENAAKLEARLRALDEELRETLAPVAERGFLVFHDAWQHLDARYGLRAVGSFRVAPERAPGAARLEQLLRKLEEQDVVCVFSEPQFNPRLIEALVADAGARTGVLDPLGAKLPTGPELYFGMMRANAATLRECLQE